MANLANVDATKRRIADAGAVPLIVRALLEPQYKWDLVMLYASAALWNLSFDDAIKEEIKTCPGALDGLEEVNKVGSETTKAKARGALWMLNADDETEVDHKISEDKVKILTGGGSTANTQIMLSYEWRTQQRALALLLKILCLVRVGHEPTVLGLRLQARIFLLKATEVLEVGRQVAVDLARHLTISIEAQEVFI